MQRSTLGSLAVVAALLTASSQSNAVDYELVGFSSTSHEGNETIRGFTEICQAEFGSEARMCNSVEVMQTVNWPPVSGLGGWVRPVLVSGPSTGAGTWTDASGTESTADLTCDAWVTLNPAYSGLVTDYYGNFNAYPCDAPVRISCCGPLQVGAAAVPSIVPWVHVLLVMTMLGTAGGVFLRRQRLALPGEERLQLPG